MARFGSILALACKDAARDALVGRAVMLAGADGAPLTLVDVVAGGGAAAVEDRQQGLARTAEAARHAGIDATEAVLQGDPVAEVIRMVLREGHDLVIAGPDIAPGLVRDCPCDVLVVKPADFVTPVRLHGVAPPSGRDSASGAERSATGEG